MWNAYLNGFRAYLELERSLSAHSVEAYLHDVALLEKQREREGHHTGPGELSRADLEAFVRSVARCGMTETSQARILSGIKSFYKYLAAEQVVTVNPAELLEGPKLKRKLPEVLTPGEIEKMIAAIDLSKPEGTRNRALVETMYSCGLRVSEVTGLRISGLFADQGFVRVTGKGDKERLIPIGNTALKYVEIYLTGVRPHVPVQPKAGDILFLNRRGSALTRVMVFYLIRDLAVRAGITKHVSPHTFRHSFATHLVEGGADLRAVQQMLGHESITTTEIYTHIDREYLRDTLRRYHPGYR